MEQAWIIMGETYLLTIVISLFVAFLIHMMTLLIRRFGTAAKPLPVSAEQVEISAQPDDPDELAARSRRSRSKYRHSRMIRMNLPRLPSPLRRCRGGNRRKIRVDARNPAALPGRRGGGRMRGGRWLKN